jgi:hypothetical protein
LSSSIASSRPLAPGHLRRIYAASWPLPGSAQIPIYREHPARILKADIALILAKAPLLLSIFSPIRIPEGVTPPASAGKGSYGGVALQVVLLLGSLICTAAILASLIFGPGLLFLVTLSLTYAIFQTQAKHLQGPRVAYSDPSLIKNPGATDDEAWLVINGICTGEIQSMADFLSEAFQRPIVGVHNRTGGFLFDLLECIIQRDFTYVTQDGTTELYRRLKGALMDPKKKKVVLLCHSQVRLAAGKSPCVVGTDSPVSCCTRERS